MATPEFVVVGHVVRDLVPEGWRLGGTATFAAAQAQRLGLSAGIVTHVGPELSFEPSLADVQLAGAPSDCTTTFENVYERGTRRQRVLSRADDISVDDVPSGWLAAPLVLLGPVCGEVLPGLGAAFRGSVVGVSAQGWLRRIDRQGRVRRSAWRGEPFWRGCGVLFVSEEDLGRRREQLDAWSAEVPIVALTRASRGARVCVRGSWRKIDAFAADEVDPTGAGDIFAAAFLVRQRETGDIEESTRFAAAAAACSVEGVGIAGVPDRAAIEARMAAEPEVVLR